MSEDQAQGLPGLRADTLRGLLSLLINGSPTGVKGIAVELFGADSINSSQSQLSHALAARLPGGGQARFDVDWIIPVLNLLPDSAKAELVSWFCEQLGFEMPRRRPRQTLEERVAMLEQQHLEKQREYFESSKELRSVQAEFERKKAKAAR